jgi:hypothetical protein
VTTEQAPAEVTSLVAVKGSIGSDEQANADYRQALQKFVASPDDARGFLALGLFFYDAMGRDKNTTLGTLLREMGSLDSEKIAVIYSAAGYRLIDGQLSKLVDKKLDKETREDRLYMVLSHHFDPQIDELKHHFRNLVSTQSIERQIIVSTLTTVAVGAIATLILFVPDIAHAVSALLNFSHGGK